MLDRLIEPFLHRALRGPARHLAARGIGADRITIAGFLVGIAAVPLLAGGHFLPALGCILANRLCDGLDGAVARIAGPSDRGAFLDIVLDFFFYAAVPFGFALADPAANGLPAAFLLLAFVGTGSSFLAFAAIAARRGGAEPRPPTKGIHYLGGITEGTETIACLAAMCIRPDWFAALAWGFGGLCLLTAATRWWWGFRAFGTR